MLKLKSAKKNYSISLPTDLADITPEMLNAITVDIKLAEHYCILALCFQVKLMDVAINVTGSKEQTVKVIPMIAKLHDASVSRVNMSVGDKALVDRSTLERGIHLTLPTQISSDNIKAYIRGCEDLRNNLLKGGDGSPESVSFIEDKSVKERVEIQLNKSPMVYILEFKVVPINDIVSAIPVTMLIKDPFKVDSKELVS